MSAAAPDPLDALASHAETIDAETIELGQAGQPDQEQTPPLTNAQVLQGAFAAGREAFCFFTKLESPRQVATDERIGQLAAVWGPVADKHGLNLGQYLGDYGPELAAALATFALVTELRAAVAAEIAAKKRSEPGSPDEPAAADLAAELSDNGE